MHSISLFFIVFGFFAGALFSSDVFAETIHLKNSSRAFEGDIVEHTDAYIVLKSADTDPKKIFFSKMDQETEQRLRARFDQDNPVGLRVKKKFEESAAISYDELSDEEKEYVDQNYATIGTVHLSVSDKEDYYQRALEFARQGDFTAALENIDLAMQNGGDQAVLYRLKGDLFHQMGRMEDSIEAYTASSKLDSSVSDIYCNRGHAYFLLQDFDKAVADYTRGLDIDSENWRCIGNRANAYLLKGDLDLAEKDFKGLETAEPVYAKIGLGNIALAKDDAKRALGYYHEVIAQEPNAREVYANMATAYFQLGQTDNAKRYLDKAKMSGVEVSTDLEQKLNETK